MGRMKRMAEQAGWPTWQAKDFRSATFDGHTYDPRQDQRRLGKQAQAVWDLMTAQGKWKGLAGNGWWTLSAIASWTHFPESSISARLRDFRKPRFGSHMVERRRRKDMHGTWEYRLVVNDGGEA